jgi:hypothetical protein
VNSKRETLAALLVLIVPLGFATKFYSGPASSWVDSYGGGILYEVFWILTVLLVWPRLSPVCVAGGVFAATSALEVLQLFHPPFLEAIRGTLLGHALIGSTFAWWDFPHYAVGCFAGALLAHAALRHGGQSAPPAAVGQEPRR